MFSSENQIRYYLTIRTKHLNTIGLKILHIVSLVSHWKVIPEQSWRFHTSY